MMLIVRSNIVLILFQDVQILKQDKWVNGDDMSYFGEWSECFVGEWMERCSVNVTEY